MALLLRLSLVSQARSKTLQATCAALMGLVLFCPSDAWPAWVGGVSGTSAFMAGTGGDDTIIIRTEGSAWLAHDRYAAGDPGFVSSIDFDSGLDGEQRIPNNGTGSVTLLAGSGADSLSVNDGFLINPNNRMEIEANTIRFGGEPGGNRPVITYTGFEHVSLKPQSPFNAGVLFISTASGVNYRISGAADQLYDISSFEAGTLDAIQGAIDISGGGIVYINDGKDISNNTYTVGDFNHITRSGAGKLSLYLTKSITLFAGTGVNEFVIKANSTPDFRIYSGQNTSRVAFGNDEGTLDDIHEPIALNNFLNSSDIISFNDTGADSGHSYSLQSSALVRNFGMVASGLAVPTILYCGRYNDTIWVEPTTRTHMEAGTGADTDILVMNTTFYPGPTTVNGETSTISDPNFAPVTFASVNHLFLFGGADANSFTVTPSAEYPIFLDASEPVVSPGDSLKLNAGGLPFILTHDEFLAYGKQIVKFLGFEHVEGPPAPPQPPPPPAPSNGIDLTGTLVNATVTPKGKKVILTAQFDEKNLGNMDASKTVVQFFLSNDDILSPDDLPLKSKKVKTLPAGQQRTIILKKKLPATANPSGKYVITVVTHKATAPEINPDNDIVVYGPLL